MRESPLGRFSPLVAPVLVLVVLGVGALVGVARYTTLLDPHTTAMPTEALHHDPKPCLRYPTAPLRSASRDAARGLIAAGITNELVSDLIGDFYARAASREAALSPIDEQLEAFAKGGGLADRLVVAVKRDVLRAELTKVLAPTPPITATIASLPLEQRTVIDAQWAREPSVFVLPGLLDLVGDLKQLSTEQRLDRVIAALGKQVAAGKQPDLDALGYPGAELNDAWGSALTLERSGDQMTLSSLGADGTAGGTGLNGDLTRTLEVRPGATTTAPSSPDCPGKTELTLARAEVDGALENMGEMSKEVRVVPAMVDGVPTGFRLLKLRAGFFSRVGLCENDVVRTLNGVSLNSPDQALEAYSRLKGATRVEVAVTREGKPLTLVLTVR